MNFATALKTLWPNGDERIPGLRDGIIRTAPRVFATYGFTTPLLIAHLMAQISHECGAGHDVIENLNYSPQGMVRVWPSRFPTIASATPFAHNPQALANKVYNGRMGNRPGSNDGWDYRGRGAVQTTGRDGYMRLTKQTTLDLITHPELLIDPDHFLECGVADFILCGCMPYALKDDFLTETKKLNGGTIGMAERRVWLKKWNDAKVAVPVPPPEALVASSEDPSTPWWKLLFRGSEA